MPKRRHPPEPKRSSPNRHTKPQRPATSGESTKSESAALDALVAALPGVEDRPALILALSEYLTELREWNARGNLVSQSDLGRLVSRHVAESFAALPWIDRARAKQVIDVGSGGGFPIVPLKLARPQLRVALVESRRMKSLFLRRVAARLDLGSFWVWSMRIESLAELPLATDGGTLEEAVVSAGEETPRARPTVDLVTVRAVAPLSDLARWSERLVSSGGRLLAFKGSRLEEEVKEWKRAPGPWRLEEITPVSPEIKLVVLLRE